MGFLYLIGGIRIPTKVYFNLSTLAADSRFYFDKRVNGLRSLQLFSCFCFIFLLFQLLKRKYNARDFDKSKAANLLKIMKGEHPTKKWQNCGTEVLCVMLFYSGADLARIVNKVLGMEFFFFKVHNLYCKDDKLQCSCFCIKGSGWKL